MTSSLLVSPCSECFRIDDIYLAILQEAYGDGEGRATVAHLALTSRMLSEGAITVLWQHLTSLVPLLGLIPENVWERVKMQTSSEERALAWCDVLQSSYMHNFLRRREGIRRLTWDQNDDIGSPRFELKTALLADLPPDFILFPQLRTYTWTASVHVYSHLGTIPQLVDLRHFIHGRLRDLVLRLPATSAPAMNTLAMVRNDAVPLRSLRIIEDTPALWYWYLPEQDGPENNAVSAAIAGVIRESNTLRVFTCTRSVSDPVFAAALHAKSLRAIEFTLKLTSHDDTAAALIPHSPALEVLSLSIQDMNSTAPAVLAAIGTVPLRRLSLNVMYRSCTDSDSDRLQEALQRLADGICAQTLERVDVYDMHEADASYELDIAFHEAGIVVDFYGAQIARAHTDCLLSLATLRPLLRLSSLTHLGVHAAALALTSADLLVMVRALPRLSVLSLAARIPFFTTSVPDLGALQWIAEHCPSLRVLSLAVGVGDAIPAQQAGWTSSSQVQTLRIGLPRGRGENPGVNGYVTALFPNAQDLQFAYYTPMYDVL
ncbi:uncharacterized protein B0H18DRAFT_1115300 [Fomitopsis serialis]|uniref:uncharacterized protein n=1 Tax=Fomitopsis serialis TaxID=139415 RepID=UPI002008C06A|nr:uncharacterized protein B0H18DRAFT_1115300 [Neoantrodia serialis]KAH9933285.1 hypothetical protein B0H18DRAFT_1115300 [Neoantrodia serialis]